MSAPGLAALQRRCWETPADEFIGVPYIAVGGAHPRRINGLARSGQLKSYRHEAATPHRMLPDDTRLAGLAASDSFMLLDRRKLPVAIYHRRMDGHLPHVQLTSRGRGLDHRFLAACLDLEDDEAQRIRGIPAYTATPACGQA